MPRRGIVIPSGPVPIVVRTFASGDIRITYPRGGRFALAAVVIPVGLGLWLCQLPGRWWTDPLEIALGLLLVGPGLAAIRWAFAERTAIETVERELIVRHGPALFERVAARLPLATLEVRVDPRPIKSVRLDSQVARRRLLAAIVPVSSANAPEVDVMLHVLQVRDAGQQEWLSLIGSQVASEVENARLALAAAVLLAREAPEESSTPSQGTP